jgi:ferrochelatase
MTAPRNIGHVVEIQQLEFTHVATGDKGPDSDDAQVLDRELNFDRESPLLTVETVAIDEGVGEIGFSCIERHQEIVTLARHLVDLGPKIDTRRDAIAKVTDLVSRRARAEGEEQSNQERDESDTGGPAVEAGRGKKKHRGRPLGPERVRVYAVVRPTPPGGSGDPSERARSNETRLATLMLMIDFDAVLLLSFGGPEGPDDVLPFLENVTHGRGIPPERLREVGAHYDHFDGVSPINEQCRRIRSALQSTLDQQGHRLPVYWGNRNWHPMLDDTVATMRDDGVRRALAITTSAYSSFSGCRQYWNDIDAAIAAAGPGAPAIQKTRPFFDHPGFVEPFRDGLRAALTGVADGTSIVFTAHSIPTAMADTSDYEVQLRTTAALIADIAPGHPWSLAWQSRSGPPHVPWLEPDINDHLRTLAGDGATAAVIVPIGFVSDHMEVVWDLDCQAQATADELGLTLRRVATPGTMPDPRFVSMLCDLVEGHLADREPLSLSALPTRPFPCAAGCCPGPSRG